MKTQKFILGSLIVAALVAGGSTAYAQQKENRDSEGKIVRGPYETNSFGSNWFISLSGGVHGNFLFCNPDAKPGLTGGLDFSFGKWITPEFGLRAGYTGLGLSNTIAGEKAKVPFHMAHGDVLWNISNTIGGYRSDRVWDFIPYVHTAFAWSNSKNYLLGAGLLNNVRLCDRLDLILDIRVTTGKGDVVQVPGRVLDLSAMLGLSVDLGKNHWKRATTIPEGYAAYSKAMVAELKENAAKAAEENKKLNNEVSTLKGNNKKLGSEVDELQKEVEKLQNRKVVAAKLAQTPGCVYFEIGETVLDSKNLYQLDFYVKNVIEQDPEAKFVLIGYTDYVTGGKERNLYLRENRVEYVSNLLRTQYNVAPERIIVKTADAKAKVSNEPALNRCVVIEYAE